MEKTNQLQQSLSTAMSVHQAGNLTDAEPLYRTILLSYPTNPDALNGLSILQIQRGNYEEAVRLLRLFLQVKPFQPDALNKLGNALRILKRFDKALDTFDRLIALNPGHVLAHYNRGVTLTALHRLEEALASYDKAVALKADYADAYINRGNILHVLERYAEALASYDKAIAITPGYAEAYYNRALLLPALNRYDEALASYRQTVALKPDTPYILGDILNARMHLADWHAIDADIALLAKGIEAGERVAAPFMLVALPSSKAQQKQCAEIYVADTSPPSAMPLWDGERYSHDKIRIGYFSADFFNHATAYLMAGLLELHDRSRFEINGFSYGLSPPDAMRNRIEKACDGFLDVSAKSDQDIAALARCMEIDIAVDLKGFTRHARTGVFALRPAPVQVHYLGYPGTLGARYTDYLVADHTVIPEEHRQYYTEKLAYLPNSYQVNDSLRSISENTFSRHELGLPEKGFVFCCFNNNHKITPDVFAIWMQLLHKVQGSVLWLLEGNRTVAKNLRNEAKARGIAENRLVFAPRMELADHLARHRQADLFLDTLPYNAHTTASDALWAGLPVLTCIGDTFAGRVAASLLKAIGLPELIATSPNEYEACAFDLATHPENLSALHRTLAHNMTTHPLFNTALFTRHIESAYTKMWARSQAGLEPDHIYIQ